jgi:hypothetical protein
VKSRRLQWTGNAVRMGKIWNAYRNLLGKLFGKRAVVRLRIRWEDNIKMILKEIGS